MNKLLEYLGYSGSVEFDLDSKCLFGKILFITDTITYEAETIDSLESAFKEAVDDYIETCSQIGKDPNRSFKGTFNIRITPELHRKAVILAVKEGISLNELTAKSIDFYVNNSNKPINYEYHDHHHYYEPQQVSKFKENFESNGDLQWTVSPLILH